MPEKGEEELKELPRCKKCGKTIFNSTDNYCPNCGDKIYMLPKNIQALDSKNVLENIHDEDIKRAHETFKNDFNCKFCMVCGKALETSEKKE